MSDMDNALLLLAKRYSKRANKKEPKQWYLTRKGPKNRKYICHICNKDICTENKNGPMTYESQEAMREHGEAHLKERGLYDFV